MKNRLNKRRKLFTFVAILLLLITTIAIYIVYSSPQFRNFARGWTTYSDQEVPFVFDHPNSWKFEKEIEHPNQQLPEPSLSVKLTAISKEDNQKILKVSLWDGPVLAIALPCSERRGDEKNCSYLESRIADYFFRHAHGTWSSKNGLGGVYSVTILEQDKVSDDVVAQIIHSIRQP